MEEPQPESQSLKEASQKLGMELSQQQLEMLSEYCNRLWEWNEKVNLTRHTSYDLFARRDLLDSLKLSEHIEDQQDVLDVGTGGGVPGLVLAILRPDLQISLCDSVAKKAKVVQEIVRQMGLPVAVYPVRVQSVLEDLRFHTLVTRASGSIAQVLNWLADYWTQFDRLLSVKGPRWVQERGEARHRGLLAGIDLRCLDTYSMPTTQSQSAILSFTKKAN